MRHLHTEALKHLRKLMPQRWLEAKPQAKRPPDKRSFPFFNLSKRGRRKGG